MVDSTDSVDKLPSPDLSSLILEDYSQSFGCSPPLSAAFKLDQKWAFNVEGSPAASGEHGSHEHLKLETLEVKPCIRSMDEAGVSGVFRTSNSLESDMSGGSPIEKENDVDKKVSSTQDITGQVGADSIFNRSEAGDRNYSRAVMLDAEANDYIIIKKEALDTWTPDNTEKDKKEARTNLVSGCAQEPEVLYTCCASSIGEGIDYITVKEEPLDTRVSTNEEEDSETDSDGDTGTSESDASSSSSDNDTEGDDENIEEEDCEDVEEESNANGLAKRPGSSKKDEDKELQDSDGFEIEDVNFSSEDEPEKAVKGPVKSKNEMDVLPPVPSVDVVLLPHHQTLPVGVVSSIVGSRVIIDGNVKHDPLNEGSILWITETRAPLGLVDEIFGPVKNPYYIVRYNSENDIPVELHVGTSVSFVAEFSSNILDQSALYKKGYDVSGENDEELEEEVEFSDDEKEAEYRRSLRQYKRGMDGQSHTSQGRNNNQYRKASDRKQMQRDAMREVKKAVHGPHTSVQQQLPPVTGGSSPMSGTQPPKNSLGRDSVTVKKAIPGSCTSVQQQLPPLTSDFSAVRARGAQPLKNNLGGGPMTVPTVSPSPHSHSSVGAQANLLSPLSFPWNPAASLHNVVPGNLMMNGPLAQAGNSAMQGVMTPFVPQLQQATGFLGGITMNALTGQSMLPLHMQNVALSGGLFMNPSPFQLQPSQLGNASNFLFQNQHQALQQSSTSQYSYGFPTQSQFNPSQAPNIFSLNGQMNPSLGSMQDTSIHAPFGYDNTSVAATNVNNREQGNTNPVPTCNNGNICPSTQFHMGTPSFSGRGAPLPRAKHPLGKRRP